MLGNQLAHPARARDKMASMSETEREPDPMPQPPPEPDLDACCGNGCDPCIFDLYDLEKDRYRQALREWEARQARHVRPAQGEGGA